MAAKKKTEYGKIKVTLVKSTIATLPQHKKIVAALGENDVSKLSDGGSIPPTSTIPNLHTGVEASCMEIFLSKNPTGFQPVALSFFAASGSYASLTPLRVCISTLGMSNGSSLGNSSVPTQL